MAGVHLLSYSIYFQIISIKPSVRKQAQHIIYIQLWSTFVGYGSHFIITSYDYFKLLIDAMYT